MNWIRRRIARSRRLPTGKRTHRAHISELIHDHADRLHRRIRPHFVVELVDRVLAHEPEPGPFLELEPRDRLATLVIHALNVCDQLEEEDRIRHGGFEAFSQAYYRMRNDAARLRTIREYLEQTIDDPIKRRDDLLATATTLDLEVLLERHTCFRERQSASIEVALGFVSGAFAAITDPAANDGQALPPMLVDSEVDLNLGRYIEPGQRWQNRLAAIRALTTMYVNLNAQDRLDATNLDVRRRVVSLVSNERENPWLQMESARVLLTLDARERETILYRRLIHRSGQTPRTDFLVRRHLVDHCLDYLSIDATQKLIDELIEVYDPSEHVRMGIADLLGRIATVTSLGSLQELIKRERKDKKPSGRVRAMCAIGAAECVPIAMKDDLEGELSVQTAYYLINRLLTDDDDDFVLEVAADSAVVFCQAALATEARDFVEMSFLPGLLQTILDRRGDPELSAKIHEALSANAEKLDRLSSTTRTRWTEYLAETALTIHPGESTTIRLDKRPEGLPAIPDEPMWLGRILADISRRDWGLSARRRGNRLTIWRGDHFRRRAWRIIHEVTHPAPNKRQAFRHTIGRVQHGELRAHPGSMDEVTATTVPGERVVIDTEGSWGRHMPLVDDLLDLPVTSPRPVTLFSSHGAVKLTPPKQLWRRIRNRIKLTLSYRDVSLLRVASLRAKEAQERRRYLETLERDYQIRCTYEPYDYAASAISKAEPSPHMASLLPRESALAGMIPFVSDLRGWLEENTSYFLDPKGNSQTALAIFAGALASLTFVESFLKRNAITRARDRVPLSIGGWGTRGKSGTERIKAGLFHGLGYHVFTKTTGCEAMFINSLPGQTSLEIFIYRPYNKATIWEQKAMIELAANVGAEVFLWECMALNPTYVQLLQHVWMRDDLVTLTNAFPDHEDIQGPAGMNVAQVISSFIPPKKTLFTTETNFLTLFRDRCEELDAELITIDPRDADLIAEDVLELYPYQEHPRNIALVARMAEHLGIERTLSMVMMAENVVPDLGVLKTYPTVKLQGRTMAFINGMSANERAGCLNNWRRMGMDKLDVENQPEVGVVTVVNNRDDRISRSDVFSRIMVQDLVVERHVIIGTNQRGLRTFIDNALNDFVPTLAVIDESGGGDGGDGDGGGAAPEQRLASHMARLRIPQPSAAHLVRRLWLYASGGNLVVAAASQEQIEERLRQLLSPTESDSLSVSEVRANLLKDKELTELIKLALVADEATEGGESNAEDHEDVPELVAPATVEEIYTHFMFILARVVVHARLQVRVQAAARGGKAAEFHQQFWECYKDLYREQLEWLEDPGATGDQVVDRVVQSATPGTRIMLLGIQNIKGTGLDFVYRWVSLDKVVTMLDAVEGDDPSKRETALRELESFGDFGMVDSGLARIRLERINADKLSPAERKQMERARMRADKIFQEKRAKLGQSGGTTMVDQFFTWLEGWFDNLDSIRRYRQSQRVNQTIVEHRISLARAAIEMRNIYARQKGGWLAKVIKSRKK